MSTFNTPEELFSQDQSDRRKLSLNQVDWLYVNPRDVERLNAAKKLIENGTSHLSGLDLWYLSFIFQHSDSPSDYLIANSLAKESFKKGFKKAVWIICASFDRYLVTTTGKQAYKTQYKTIDGEKIYASQDSNYTNEYLQTLDLPTHEEFEESLIS